MGPKNVPAVHEGGIQGGVQRLWRVLHSMSTLDTETCRPIGSLLASL